MLIHKTVCDKKDDIRNVFFCFVLIRTLHDIVAAVKLFFTFSSYIRHFRGPTSTNHAAFPHGVMGVFTRAHGTVKT